MSFDGDGNLYLIDNQDQELYRVNKTTGRILETVDNRVEQGLGQRRPQIEGLAWDPVQGQLVFTETQRQQLGQLSLGNGHNTVLDRTKDLGLRRVEAIDFQVLATDENQAPELEDDQATTVDGVPITLDVLANDRDPDGDVLTIIGVGNPSNGNVVIVDNQLVYTANFPFNGTDVFSYTVADGQGASATAQVTVTVEGDLEAPILTGALLEDTGVNDGDGITNNPTLQGTVTDNRAVASPSAQLNGNGLVDVTDWVQGDGGFRLNVTQLGSILGATLGDGVYSLSLRATDPTGNFSTATLDFVLDTSLTIDSFGLASESDTEPVGDGKTTEEIVSLVGHTEAGATVVLQETGATTTADNLGQFRFEQVALAY